MKDKEDFQLGEFIRSLKHDANRRKLIWYLTELREVVLLAEGTLPETCSIITNGLVVALSLRPPVSNTSNYAGYKLALKKKAQKG